MKVMKKLKYLGIILLCLTILTGCASDADIVSRNISKEADQFRVRRRIVFINLRSDTYLFAITGNCSVDTDNSSNKLDVTCKVGDDQYQKHFLRLSDETTYTAEQLEYSEVSKYKYEIVFKPESILPIQLDME
jgi:hypothetical protein